MKKSVLRKKRYRSLLFFFIILLAVFLRVYGLDKNPIELFGDEVDAGYQAYSLMSTGHDYRGNFLPLYAQSFYEWRAPLLMYSIVPFIKIFGLNEWGIRLNSAFWGIINIVAFSYLLEILGVRISIILFSAALIAISPWHIQYSRAGFEITLASSLIILGILYFFKSLEDEKKKKIILSGMFFALSLYAYNTANIISPSLLLASGLTAYFFARKRNGKKAIKKTLFVGLIATIIALPLIPKFIWGSASGRFKAFSVIGHPSILDKAVHYRNESSSQGLAKLFYNRPLLWTQTIAKNYVYSFSPENLFGEGDVTFRHSLHEIGNLYLFQLPFLLLGFLWLVKNSKKEPADTLLLLWLLIAPIPASLTIDGKNHATRLFFLVFPLAYFSASGLVYFLRAVKDKKILFPLSILAISFWILFSFFRYQYFYWVHYPKQSWRWWHYGYKDLFQEVEKRKREKEYSLILIESTYEPAAIRYLFWAKYDPERIFDWDVSFQEKSVLGFDGHCLPDSQVCFVNYGEDFKPKNLQDNVLYVISQSKNVAGDWDWEKSPPENVKVVKTIRSPLNEPIFYLAERQEGSSR